MKRCRIWGWGGYTPRVWGWGGRAVAILAALAMAFVAALASVTPATALGKVKCSQNGNAIVAVGNFDPIVNHDGQGSMHEHEFFANTAWLKLPNPDAANYSDLEGKSTNCAPVAGISPSPDTAGYWVPSLRVASTGALVPVNQFTAYYRAFNHADFGPGAPFPADTRLVAHVYDWSCGQFSGIGPVSYLPNCTGQSGKPGHTLTAHVTFPSCWDGVLPNHQAGDVGDTEDTAHYAYTVKGACPAGFPNKMVELRETVQYSFTGNGANLVLSSDQMAGTSGGRSMHGDFWNAWVQSGFQHFVSECVQKVGYVSSQCG